MSSNGVESADAAGRVNPINLVDRLEQVKKAEDQIRDLLKLSQACISELAKEKQTTKHKMEEASQQFKNTLANVNNVLSAQMAYLQNVCVGSAHQGSTFASQQNIALAESAEFALHTELAQLSEKHFPPDITPQ